MASLQRQSRGITIKQRLGAFSKQNILFSLILSICVLCFSYMSAVLYEKNGERQQELNRFYQQLEIIHTDLTEYTSRDNRNLSQPILEALPQLEKMGAFLKAIRN